MLWFHYNPVTTMSDIDVNEEEDEEIDEEQVADYCAMLDKLGSFPVRSPRRLQCFYCCAS
jgi:hypothetical protein